jgi:hypothetical protein
MASNEPPRPRPLVCHAVRVRRSEVEVLIDGEKGATPMSLHGGRGSTDGALHDQDWETLPLSPARADVPRASAISPGFAETKGLSDGQHEGGAGARWIRTKPATRPHAARSPLRRGPQGHAPLGRAARVRERLLRGMPDDWTEPT